MMLGPALDITFVGVASLLVFISVLIAVVGKNFGRLFLRKFARRHRITGLVYLATLVVGITDLQWAFLGQFQALLAILLPTVGVVLSVTAAYDFKEAHARVKNLASGTLDKDQTVTFEEMIEHSFYQGLNVAQAVYLYTLDSFETSFYATSENTWKSRAIPALMYLAVSAPWLLRSQFPVNHFSANYTVQGRNPWALTSILYRIKKYQYVLYKHALFYGLNVTAAVFGSRGLARQPFFSLYWLCLNASYVMEFFLQTLVKRGYATQAWLLVMQKLLMLVSTVAAVQLLWYHVDPLLALVSVTLNFTNRGHDPLNATVLLLVAMAYVIFVRE
eukprot:INCI9517.3.p1 GENE.INCI9517.3~~INCI9517.3.p1  ORF type:complete len:331 (-),score=33.88 INCI9517.3:810-1802(-)